MATKKPALKKRNGGLGKGLGALLSDADVVKRRSGNESDDSAKVQGGVFEVEIDAVEVNPFQPRTEFDADALEELADSIRIHGLIQPITIRRMSENSYQLISGERRLRASKIAGLETVPAYVRLADDQQMLEMAIIENIQREDLNPIEVALSYRRLIIECELRQEDLGKRVGKQRSTVTNYLRLLKLPSTIQAALRDKQLSMGHARALISVGHSDMQLAVFARIIKEELSVRKTEELVKSLSEQQATVMPKNRLMTEQERAVLDVQQRLSSQFGTKVKVQSSKDGKGEIKIPFFSTDDLNRLLELLGY